MALLAKDLLCVSDNKDTVTEEPVTENSNRGAKKRASGVCNPKSHW